MIKRQAVIVGTGPAGMAAAIAMVETGLRPLVIDENPQGGRQIYRRPPAEFATEKLDWNTLVHVE